MKYLFVLSLGIAIGVAGYWYFTEGQRDTRIRAAQGDVARSVERMGTAIKEKVSEIRVEDIQEELARSGRVVRQRAQEAGNALTDSADDLRITGVVKARLATDRQLSAQEIKV